MDGKICTKCGEMREWEDFRDRKGVLDGKRSWCKKCEVEYKRLHRSTKQGQISRLEENRRYRRTKNGRIVNARAHKKYIKKYPEKKRARGTLNMAIASGSLVRSSCCESCGSEYKLEGHHFDYKRQRDVRWLCKKCHGLLHKWIDNFRNYYHQL